jgi:hypothetical protein
MESPAPADTKRRSRFRRAGGRANVAVSERDLRLFAVLARYRYLPSNFLHAFVGGNEIRFKQRLGDLFHEGYLGRPQRQWLAMNARYRPAIYELDQKAEAELRRTGLGLSHRIGNSGSFAHELMVCLVAASFELAATAEDRLSFVSWRQLLARAPTETQRFPNPFAFPVAISHRDGRLLFDLKPDGRPFGLDSSLGNGLRRALFFPGIEVDRHTEPLTTFDLNRSSVVKKVLAYREMVATELYKTQLGMPNMLVPIVTVNAEHMHNMMRLVLSLTNGKGASYLLFKTIPDFVAIDRTIEPNGSIISEPWLRAGHPPFDILKELRAA